ncbi:hypothetical protein BV25DRAFT_416650 [Artomyces pyxidatus]|uniref:Uncharacterized protein n=1 Tax=Artomyces pyxidatus TaxID=48021 RepID=A0ACB8T4Z3_9AGAM|nr:hypothetical protein BV25DRAFT_416650 [Artomyces pyxidatus]
MESLSELRAILYAVLSPGSAVDEQELFDLLVQHRGALVKVFDVPPRSENERKELQGGKTTLNGRQMTVNNDFATQVIFLAQTLDCSERYVAGLMRHVISENINRVPVDILEEVILEHHRRRRDLAECLRFLLEASELGKLPDPVPIHRRIAVFVNQSIIPFDASPSPPLLGWKVLTHIEGSEQAIANAQTAKQNAGSTTVIQGNNIRLSQDVLSARLESLRHERRCLGTDLFLIARLGYLSPRELEQMVPWLQQNPRHPMSYYILSALLAALDPFDSKAVDAPLRQKLVTFPGTLKLMKTRLATTADWKDPGMKATVLLKWTLFLTEARHRDASLENKEGFRTEELETNVWNAVQGDTFTYLAGSVAKLQRKEGQFPAGSFAASIIRTPESEQPQELPEDDFKPAVLQAFEILVRSVITHASSELRKIKQRQEDYILANARSDRSRYRSTTARSEPEAPTPNPRNDIAMLFSFIGILFSALPPERALQFWGSGPSDIQRASWMERVEASAGKLPAFLQWAVWSTQPRDGDMSIALYDMLAGLAKGQHCSELAYNFLARGGGEIVPGSTPSSSSTSFNSGTLASWNTIFGLLDSWAAASANARSAQQVAASQAGFMSSHQHQHTQQHAPLTEKDVWLGQCCLRLLATVVSNSVSARLAISGHTHLRAIPTLVSLIPLGVPLELKGSVFSTLAAFCEPGAGPPGVEICRAVWMLMERLEVINVRGGGSLAKKGVQAELELVEEMNKTYPETIPFLKLLATLIHTPKQLPLNSRVADSDPVSTIPENLGQPYRQVGIGPFLSFVVDEIFLRIPAREYMVPEERWQMNDLCLSFVERCLASYDLEALLSSAEEHQIRRESVIPMLLHPGFEILHRLLTTSPLQASILMYLGDGVAGFDKGFENQPLFKSTVIRVLRIVHRVLEIQDAFLDVLVPLLAEMPDPPLASQPRSFYTRFDHALSFASHYVPTIATYVTYTSHPELALLSVKILTQLTHSSAFPNLTTLLERSSDSVRIIDGYRQILGIESLYDVDAADADAEQFTGAGAPDPDEIPAGLPQAVRLAALDLLIQNTKPGSAYPNVAHLLLLGATNLEQIQDPHALGAQTASIHVILDWVNMGVPRMNRKGKEREHEAMLRTDPLFNTLPALAERLYRVVYQLCMHPRTSDFTMRYLRTREDFFVRQLIALPFKIPPAPVPTIEVQYNDGARIETSVSTLASFLRLRSYVFDLVALDLHALTNRGHLKSVSELLELIFGNEEQELAEEEDWEDAIFQRFHEVGQSHMRVIEYVQSLSFEWTDSLNVAPLELELLGGLNMGSCVRIDDKGCEVVDQTAVLSLLASARQTLHAQGRIITPAHQDRLSAELAYVLASCAAENHRREVLFATATSFEAWRRLVDMTLVKCFTRLPRDRRETMLSDLLHELPPIIRSGNIAESTAVLLSEASLSLITKLREDRHSQRLVQGVDSEAGSLPAERLYTLLRSLLECILDHRIELVRGNLYAALINYFHLIAHDTEDVPLQERPGNLALSLSTSVTGDDFSFSDRQLAVTLPGQLRKSTTAAASTVEAGSLAVLKPIAERLVAVVSRDATDGTEVWKTVAYMLLDCLVHVSRGDKQYTILSSLMRHGFLMHFVRDLKESDLRLQSVLKPDPDDLNPLYVYEAKMSLLIRIARTRQGAERLLESRLLPTLADCDFLDTLPEADQAFIDQDRFLGSAVQRYHQLFMPALQLVDAVLATLGSSHTTAASQALEFLSNHRDTAVILLKNDADEISLSVLDEIHLLVYLCSVVYPLVPKSELISGNAGFGSVHVAILSLAARSFGISLSSQQIRPQTDSEQLDATVRAPGYGRETKFEIAIQRKEQLLRKALIVYIGTASEFTEPDITLVLSPVLITARHDDRSSRFIATIPTVGDAIEALSDLCAELSETLNQISGITKELLAKDHIRVEDISESINLPNPDVLSDLDIGQKRYLICLELERIRTRTRETADTLISSVEMLLLLLWRHIMFYSEGRHINNPDLKASTSGVMRHMPQSTDGEVFRAEAAKRLAPALSRLTMLDLSYESTASDWRANEAYIEIMSRRLRDTVGLHVEDETQMMPDGISI